ncbi:hypothetical protein Trydic_g6351 [Trypoxylus dichotomus]
MPLFLNSDSAPIFCYCCEADGSHMQRERWAKARIVYRSDWSIRVKIRDAAQLGKARNGTFFSVRAVESRNLRILDKFLIHREDE